MNFPIIELNPQVVNWIERIPELKEAIGDEIKYNGLNPNIHFISDWDFLQKNGEIVIETDDKSHIYFSQPFCQYLWSIALYLSVFFNTYINFPIYFKLGKFSLSDKPNMNAMKFAEHIFFLARRLKDTNFNPRVVNAFPSTNNLTEFKDEVECANKIYCGALTFMFSHEFAHQYLGHTRIKNTYSRSIKDEIEADNVAISFLKPEFDGKYGNIYQFGIVTLLAALLLSDKKSISGGGTHPDMDIRINNIIKHFELSELDPLWGYLATAIKLWLLNHGGLSIEDDQKIMQTGVGSYREFLDNYLSELESTRKKMFPKECPRAWDI